MNRIGLPFVTVDGVVLHPDAKFLANRIHQRSDGAFVLIEVLWSIGSYRYHRIQAVQKLDILFRKRALDFLECRLDIVRERRSGEIDNQLLAEIQRSEEN